jgi:hypothetical protein
MARKIKFLGRRVRKGKHMTMGKGWKLAFEKGRKRVFYGTLLATFNFGSKRLAVFNVPK